MRTFTFIKTKTRRPLQLQTKLFLAYFLSSETILIAFAIFFYWYVSPMLINNEMDQLEALNTSFMEQVESNLQDLDTVSTNINYSSLMKDKLDSAFNLKIDRATLPGLADLFVTINGTDLKSDQINLYDLEGNVVQVGLITNTDQKDLDTLPWFDRVLALKGHKEISQPFYTNDYAISASSADWYIALRRTYTNTHQRTVGAIETIKACKKIFKPLIIYEKKTDMSAISYIFDEAGHLIYPYNPEDLPSYNLDYYFLQSKSDHPSNVIYNRALGQDERYVDLQSDYSGWTYITIMPEATILEPVNRLMMLLILVVGLIFLISLTLAYNLAQNMVRPVKNLKHIIQKLELDNLGTTPEGDYTTSYNELDEVYNAFQILSKELKISMDELIDTRQQELKSRTLALQSQTNPHFYYNTLSSIIVLAENGQNEEVIRLCRNLTQIMRYITDTRSTLVSIEEEMSYVEKYLYCMKVRYQSSLTFNIDIDEHLLKKHIPKLIIQPMVENAIKYGTDCLPPWHINITGRYEEDCWVIEVVDSGSGFSDNAMDQIKSRIDYTLDNPGMPELMIDGLGMINVFMRWKIFCKGKHIFEYGNTKTGNGSVRIGMKLKKGIGK